MKYRKKPVIIEAFRWAGDNTQIEDPEWIIEAIKSGRVKFITGLSKIKMSINTLEGVHTAQPGDYIIKGVMGEIYPCKPDIFEMTYEAVDEIPTSN